MRSDSDDGIPIVVKSERPSFPRTVSELGPAPRGVQLQAKKNTILKSHGRPPWFALSLESKENILTKVH